MITEKQINPTAFHKLLSYPLSILFTPLAGLLTLLYSAFALLVVLLIGSSQKFGDWIIYAWSKTMALIFRIDLDVQGLANLPEGGCLFVFNHNSLFDISVFHYAIRKSARFGAKIELFKIPFFGSAMRRLGALPIARGNIEKVMRVYQRSIPKVINEKKSFVLAAEGTRNSEGGVGKKFKSGPVIFALSGQFPIVPVVIIGTFEIIPKNGFLASWGRYRNPVTLKVLPPISTLGLSTDDRHSIKDSLRQQMTKAFDEG